LTHRRGGGSVVDDHRSPFSGGGHLQDSTSPSRVQNNGSFRRHRHQNAQTFRVEMTDSRKINNIKVTTVIDKDMRIVGAGSMIQMMMILLDAQLMVMSGIDQEIAIDNTTGNTRYSR
jgi:hypothetical protein